MLIHLLYNTYRWWVLNLIIISIDISKLEECVSLIICCVLSYIRGLKQSVCSLSTCMSPKQPFSLLVTFWAVKCVHSHRNGEDSHSLLFHRLIFLPCFMYSLYYSFSQPEIDGTSLDDADDCDYTWTLCAH